MFSYFFRIFVEKKIRWNYISLSLSILILRLILFVLSRARSKVTTGKIVLKLQSGIITKRESWLDRRDVTQGQLNVSVERKELVQHLKKKFFLQVAKYFRLLMRHNIWSHAYRIFRFAILINGLFDQFRIDSRVKRELINETFWEGFKFDSRFYRILIRCLNMRTCSKFQKNKDCNNHPWNFFRKVNSKSRNVI